MIRKILIAFLLFPILLFAQINTDRVMTIARNALYFEDYVLSIQYFNQVINAKPYLYEPYFYRGLAKINLDDYQGAEKDCDAAIQRNPFVVGAYQIRGLARIRQNNYDGAIEDYRTALKYSPENLVLWHNLSLCHMQQKDYDAARDDLEQLLRIAPRYTRAYLMRGEVSLQQKDTLQALRDFEKAIEMDKYDSDGWGARGLLWLQQGQYEKAESDLTQAIHLSARNAGYYINRALARIHQNNLRGAMGDYDLALDIDPDNFLGHYNRGLLRARVGDDNRAIQDFDFVLKIEPDNMMATFNRGLLRAQTGDYRGAVRDYSKVIDEYPAFTAGYHHRADAYRKLNEHQKAEQDEERILKINIDRRNAAVASNNLADKENGEESDNAQKTRKKSDKNMNNYRKIVIADESEAEQRYKSDYRGRVQDRNVTVKLEPMYALTYYEKTVDVKRVVHYHKYIEELNRSGLFPRMLRITNMEASLTEEQVNAHFAWIDTHTSGIVADDKDAKKRFLRGMDFYLVQDFSSSIDDFTQAILYDETFFPAYFMRALVRYKQLEYRRAETASGDETVPVAEQGERKRMDEVTTLDYDIVKKDLENVIRLAPDFVYAYYNRGNVLSLLKDYRGALSDYDKAIELNKDFAEAYYNRGLTHIFLNNNKQGIADLSKAGELGIVSAYNIIKRFTDSRQ